MSLARATCSAGHQEVTLCTAHSVKHAKLTQHAQHMQLDSHLSVRSISEHSPLDSHGLRQVLKCCSASRLPFCISGFPSTCSRPSARSISGHGLLGCQGLLQVLLLLQQGQLPGWPSASAALQADAA